MDVLLRTLKITTSQSITDVTVDCVKLINWLQCNAYDGNCATLTYKDIEAMFKATLYLHNCFNTYGEELLLAMVADCPWARSQLEQYYAQYTGGTCVAQLCRQVIAMPRHGVRIAQMTHLLHLLSETELSGQADEYLSQLSEVSTSDESANNVKSDMNCMLNLVQRIFHTPGGEIQIERATRRMLLYLPFNLLGQLFKVDAKSPMYNRCSILAELICKQLQTGISMENERDEKTEQRSKVAAHFIQAIYVHAAGTMHGLQFLWQCLGFQAFAHGLMQYLLDYYGQHLLQLDLECMQVTSANVGATELMPALRSVLFLTHALLSRKSPCYLEFFARIRETHYSDTLLALCNKMAYVFD